MTDEIWFEEELLPAQPSLEAVVESMKEMDDESLYELTGLEAVGSLTKGELENQIRTAAKAIRGFVRSHYPRAMAGAPEQADDEKATEPDVGSSLPLVQGKPYLVRLGLEFDMPEEVHASKWRYKKVWCRAHVTADDEQCLARVVEVFPDRLFEGEPAMVKVELKPTIKWGPIQSGIGGVSTDVQVGVVAPATLGYLGEDDREPYWVMSEKQKEIRGRYHFWMLLDVPEDCDPAQVKLSLYGEGDLQSHLWFIPVGPKRRRWADRKHLTLADILAR